MFEDVIPPPRKMSQYIATYHQGSVIKTEFENVKLKDKGAPTVDSLSRELRTLRESAQKGIQMTWSEIEQLETEKALLMERNSLIEEKIKALNQKNVPATDEGEILEGWGEETSDDAPWLGWNASTEGLDTNITNEDESIIGDDRSKGQIEYAEQVSSNIDDTDPENTKVQRNALIRPISLFVEKNFKWKKKKEYPDRSHPTDDHIKELRQRLANLELQSVESCQQLKEKIWTRDENISALDTLYRKHEKIIEESLKELRRLRLRLKEKPDKSATDSSSINEKD